MNEEAITGPNSKKRLLYAAGAVAVLVLLAAAYWLWPRQSEFLPGEKAVESVEKMLKSSGAGTLPEIDPLSNPLERAPNVNPVDKANPFSGMKINPFE